MVYEMRLKFGFPFHRAAVSNEDGLALVALGEPDVRYKNSCKVIEVGNVLQKCYRKKVKNDMGFRIHRTERSEVPFTFNRYSLVADSKAEMVVSELFWKSKYAEWRC